MKLELTEGFGCRETRPSGCIEREREKKKCFRQCKFQDTPRFELVIFGKFLLVNHAGKTWKECSNAALNDADQNFSGMSMISTWRQLHNRGMPQIFENVGCS